MKRYLRAVVRVVIVLILLLATLFTISRLSGPSQDERAALALMKPQPAPAGRNVAAALWLLPYDVPDAQQAPLLARDVSRLARQTAESGVDDANESTYTSIAAEEFALLYSENPQRPYCKLRDEDCLATVRADVDGYTHMLARDTRLLERVRALDTYTFHRVPADPHAQIFMAVATGPVRVLRTRHALDIVQGNGLEGLAGTCGEITTWRRLGGDTDSLVISMIATAVIDGATDMIAQTLAQLPPGTALPDRCKSALASITLQDVSMCNAMRGEFAYFRNFGRLLPTRENDSWATAMLSWLVYDPDKAHAMHALTLAPACGHKADDAFARDVPFDLFTQQISSWRLGCVANIVGCSLGGMVVVPAYNDYAHRRQDIAAKLRMTATLVWLHETSTSPLPLDARLRDAPDASSNHARPVQLTDDGRSLQVQAYSQRHHPVLTLPLPSSLLHTDHNTGSHSAK